MTRRAQPEQEFPTEWTMYRADEEARGYEEERDEGAAQEAEAAGNEQDRQASAQKA